MDKKILKSELHELVDEFMREWCGEPGDSPVLHEEIDRPDERGSMFAEFTEWVGEKYNY